MANTKKAERIKALKLSQIRAVWVGDSGCSIRARFDYGENYCASAHAEDSPECEEYLEVNDDMVKEVFETIQKYAADADLVDDYVRLDICDRSWVAFFTPSRQVRRSPRRAGERR